MTITLTPTAERPDFPLVTVEGADDGTTTITIGETALPPLSPVQIVALGAALRAIMEQVHDYVGQTEGVRGETPGGDVPPG